MDSAHVISPGIRIDGSVQGSGSLDVQGEVHGDVVLSGTVLISATGVVEGAVEADEVIVLGRVVGPVRGHDSVRLESEASVHGDVTSDLLTMHPQATLKGRVQMALDLASSSTTRSSVRSRR